jgi:tRNA pseudouridine-54 N-methylase
MKVLFVVILEEKPPPQNFSLKNLPETRIDVVARVILSVFPKYVQHLQPKLHILFTQEEPFLLTVDDLIPSTHHDEISVAAEIREIISSKKDNYMNLHLQATWQPIDNIKNYLAELTSEYTRTFYLHEMGIPLNDALTDKSIRDSKVFILGGRKDISVEHEKLLANLNYVKINLGKRSYLASSCITKVLYQLENLF